MLSCCQWPWQSSIWRSSGCILINVSAQVQFGGRLERVVSHIAMLSLMIQNGSLTNPNPWDFTWNCSDWSAVPHYDRLSWRVLQILGRRVIRRASAKIMRGLGRFQLYLLIRIAALRSSEFLSSSTSMNLRLRLTYGCLCNRPETSLSCRVQLFVHWLVDKTGRISCSQRALPSWDGLHHSGRRLL